MNVSIKERKPISVNVSYEDRKPFRTNVSHIYKLNIIRNPRETRKPHKIIYQINKNKTNNILMYHSAEENQRN